MFDDDTISDAVCPYDDTIDVSILCVIKNRQAFECPFLTAWCNAVCPWPSSKLIFKL